MNYIMTFSSDQIRSRLYSLFTIICIHDFFRNLCTLFVIGLVYNRLFKEKEPTSNFHFLNGKDKIVTSLLKVS